MNIDNFRYYKSLDKERKNMLCDMYVNDGAYMVAYAYQKQNDCSDEERDKVEDGVDGVKTFIDCSAMALYVGVVVQTIIFAGKILFKAGKFVGKRF